MIASKYLKSKIDYVNLITTTKKLFDLLDCFHYNPIRVSTTKLFPNMQTQHLYTKNDKLIPDMFKYIAWYTINYNEKDTTIENIEYKNIEFTVTIPSWQNYYYGHDEYYDEQKLNRTIPDGVHSLGRVPQNYFHGIKELTIPNTVRKNY
ncbi:Leucine rich repeat containing protein BspA family protein [Entamoeba marina]